MVAKAGQETHLPPGTTPGTQQEHTRRASLGTSVSEERTIPFKKLSSQEGKGLWASEPHPEMPPAPRFTWLSSQGGSQMRANAQRQQPLGMED